MNCLFFRMCRVEIAQQNEIRVCNRFLELICLFCLVTPEQARYWSIKSERNLNFKRNNQLPNWMPAVYGIAAAIEVYGDWSRGSTVKYLPKKSSADGTRTLCSCAMALTKHLSSAVIRRRRLSTSALGSRLSADSPIGGAAVSRCRFRVLRLIANRTMATDCLMPVVRVAVFNWRRNVSGH